MVFQQFFFYFLSNTEKWQMMWEIFPKIVWFGKSLMCTTHYYYDIDLDLKMNVLMTWNIHIKTPFFVALFEKEILPDHLLVFLSKQNGKTLMCSKLRKSLNEV